MAEAMALVFRGHSTRISDLLLVTGSLFVIVRKSTMEHKGPLLVQHKLLSSPFRLRVSTRAGDLVAESRRELFTKRHLSGSSARSCTCWRFESVFMLVYTC